MRISKYLSFYSMLQQLINNTSHEQSCMETKFLLIFLPKIASYSQIPSYKMKVLSQKHDFKELLAAQLFFFAFIRLQ